MRAQTFLKLGLAGVALCLQIAVAQDAGQPAASAATLVPQRGGPGAQPPDPRVQQRTYLFKDTNNEIPYAVFVSSKVTKDKKNPLIIALHGLGGTHNSLMHGNALDLADDGGYILVGPMGYNPRGWYGVPVGPPRPPRPGAPKANPAAANDPPNLRELSQKDVLNVLEIIRKEFNVDERRTYLMGHSMGGAGTLYLGAKYASDWAAIAAIAPAAFSMQANAVPMLTPIKDTMPVIIAQGDADTAVPVENTRHWADALKELNMNYKYVEMPGEDHGSIIAKSTPAIFAFFAEHSKH